MEMRAPLAVDRLIAELNALAQISAAEPPVVTRIVFSEADLRARAYVKSLCRDAGLDVKEDAIGNTFARWVGSEPDLAPCWNRVAHRRHSQCRPIRRMRGVLGGLEAIRVLQQLGYKPRRSIELVIFTAEEPTRFGIGCPESHEGVPRLPRPRLLALRAKEDRSLEDLRTHAGFTGPPSPSRSPRAAFISSSNFTSSRAPSLSRKTSISALLPTSPHRPACASSSKAKEAVRAES